MINEKKQEELAAGEELNQKKSSYKKNKQDKEHAQTTRNNQKNYLEKTLEAAAMNIRFIKEVKKPAIIMAICALICVFIAYRVANLKPINHYYAVNDKGQMLQLAALNQPIYTNRVISQFVTDALGDTFNYTFFNYQDHFRKMLDLYFTSDGMSSFMNSLKESGNIDFVEKNKVIVKAAISQVPIITQKSIINNIYTWHLLTKIIVTTTNGADLNSNNYDVYMTVQRTSNLSNKYALRISQLVVRGGDDI